MLTQSVSAPTGATISQTDFSGSPSGSRGYSNNSGPPGETFTPSTAFTLTSVTVKGASSNNADNGDGTFDLQIGSVNSSTGAITQLDFKTAPVVNVAANTSNYVTLTLANPVSLSAGVLYKYTIFTVATNFYFGFDVGTGDVYPGGMEFNNDSSTMGGGNPSTVNGNGFVNPQTGVDTMFYLVPEPSTVTLAAVAAAGGALLFRRRRASGNSLRLRRK